jgi:ribonuclease P protein component
MLKKSNRIRDRRLFRQVMAGKRICSNSYFTALAMSSPDIGTNSKSLPNPRFGVVISKRVHKRAVRRNKIRRRLQEILRCRLLSGDSKAIRQYTAIVFIVREAALEAEYRDLEKALLHCFNRTNTDA